MTRNVLWGVLLSISWASPAWSQGILSPQEIASRSTPSLVHISALDRDGAVLGTGSGFFVDSQGTIATNYHVIERAADLRIRLMDGRSFAEVYLVQLDSVADLALLRLAIESSHLTLASDDPPAIGEDVYVMGNPLGLDATLSNGLVGARRVFEGLDWLQITAPVSPGSSGGPVLARTGEVVGVVTASVTGGQNLNLAVATRHLRELMGAAEEVALFRAAARPRTATLLGFQGFPWGTEEGDVERVRGVPEGLDEQDGWRILQYAVEFAGYPAVEAYYFAPAAGLAMGQVFLDLEPAVCARVFGEVQASVSSRFPGVEMNETLERPPRGVLCDQLLNGEARWSARWDLEGGRVVSMLLPRTYYLSLRVIFTPLDS